jgi:hypothetical protein
MTGKKKAPCCDRCGGFNVAADATASWDSETGDWVLESVCDSAYCYDCELVIKYLDWKEEA